MVAMCCRDSVCRSEKSTVKNERIRRDSRGGFCYRVHG